MEVRNELFDVSRITEVELIYKNPVKPAMRASIKKSKDAYDLFINNWNLGKVELLEQFKVMLLSRRNKVLGIFTLSSGGVHGTIVDRKILFATALKANACSIILAHNHPSGNLMPSHADLRITEQIIAGGNLLDINVEDHLIIGMDEYYSFKDNGNM